MVERVKSTNFFFKILINTFKNINVYYDMLWYKEKRSVLTHTKEVITMLFAKESHENVICQRKPWNEQTSNSW